ncbi:MAG: fumarate hydratase [Syntrophales bacterium]|nr:fumarate hydratase [Syntrophales bacterium]
MKELTENIVELVRLASTDLPADVEDSLRRAVSEEREGSAAHGALKTILKNVEISRNQATPVCQDTGTPIFYVSLPVGLSLQNVRQQVDTAIAQATRLSYLRPNAVNALTDKNTGNNVGDEFFPVIHVRESKDERLTMDIILKGGGSENVGIQYSIPYAPLKAGRDLDGVRRCVLDAVYKAQGQGCSPAILGVAIGGDRGSGYEASKEVLLRKITDVNPDPALRELEDRITCEANQLGIGPMGFGGKTTVLATKIASLHRLPACYYVTVTYMCWACRRRRMIVEGGRIRYE